MKPSITLKLNIEEALWLKNVIQNSIHDGESAEDAEMRRFFWETLTAPPEHKIEAITLLIVENTLKWNIRSVLKLEGYYIYYGVSPGEYIEKVKVKGAYTQNFNLKKLPVIKDGVSYYISVTAVREDGTESEHSDEIVYVRKGRRRNKKTENNAEG